MALDTARNSSISLTSMYRVHFRTVQHCGFGFSDYLHARRTAGTIQQTTARCSIAAQRAARRHRRRRPWGPPAVLGHPRCWCSTSACRRTRRAAAARTRSARTASARSSRGCSAAAWPVRYGRVEEDGKEENRLLHARCVRLRAFTSLAGSPQPSCACSGHASCRSAGCCRYTEAHIFGAFPAP